MMPTSLILFNIVLEVLATQSDKKKKQKESKLERNIKISLFANYVILYIENPKYTTPNY